MSTTSASVIFITAHYDLHCDVPIRSGRALDVFNDTTTRYLQLENVRLFHQAQQEPVLIVPSTLLVKDNVYLALLLSEDRSTASKVFFAAQERRSMHAVLTLPTVIVEGTIHAKMSNDAQSFLSLEAGSFFPVTNAVVYGYDRIDLSVKSPVVLVKKEAVSSLALQRTA